MNKKCLHSVFSECRKRRKTRSTVQLLIEKARESHFAHTFTLYYLTRNLDWRDVLCSPESILVSLAGRKVQETKRLKASVMNVHNLCSVLAFLQIFCACFQSTEFVTNRFAENEMSSHRQPKCPEVMSVLGFPQVS